MIARRISVKELSDLCQRVATAFDVGHDPHRIFLRESERKSGRHALRMNRIAHHVENGGSLTDAVMHEGNYFPAEFVQMVEVGERTGRLDSVLFHMGEYYSDLNQVKREFINSLLWPLVQLLFALIAIGIMVYVPDLLNDPGSDEPPVDILGIGVYGFWPLMTYISGVLLLFLLATTIAVLGAYGYLNPLAKLVRKLPLVGPTLSIFAEARFVQTLSLALSSGMDVWTSVELAFLSAHNPLYQAKAAAAGQAVLNGRELHQILDETGVLSAETIDAVRLGEETGRLSETLAKHFHVLRGEAKTLLARVGFLASTAIWILISALLILVIFRVFMTYLGSIESAGEGLMQRTLPPGTFD